MNLSAALCQTMKDLGLSQDWLPPISFSIIGPQQHRIMFARPQDLVSLRQQNIGVNFLRVPSLDELFQLVGKNIQQIYWSGHAYGGKFEFPDTGIRVDVGECQWPEEVLALAWIEQQKFLAGPEKQPKNINVYGSAKTNS